MGRCAFLLVTLLSLGCAPAHHPATGDAGRDAGGDGGCATATGSPVTITVASGLNIGPNGVPDVPVTIPDGCWSSIVVNMTVSSECVGYPVPSGQSWPTNCDPYDRLAQVTRDDTGTTPLMLLDAVTSFGGTATWQQDVTDYAPALIGDHSIHISVGTYDEPPATGSMGSHDVDVSVTLTPGMPPHDVLAVTPLFREEITSSAAMLMASVTPPAGATTGRLDFFTSGHGGNGEPPCDEFCQKYNDVSLDGMEIFHQEPWVSCANNCTQVALPRTEPISCGGESFDYYCQQNPEACPPSATDSRANWCPSQIIVPFQLAWPGADLTGAHEVGLNVEDVDGDWSTGLAAVFYREWPG